MSNQSNDVKQDSEVLEGYPLMKQLASQHIAKEEDFKQAGDIYRKYTKEQQDTLVTNVVSELSQVEERTRLIAICNFYRADEQLGHNLADRLGVDISPYVGMLNG
ncbi:catalase-related domain-containing protein [Halalkalibacter sp. AB-rgal2]|uniref:catalase-related domain-containing protein n=1 Tax=Halalkalibacter sp. AB-rgal2 TaxID=3242695 RepID=UPI00359D2CF7